MLGLFHLLFQIYSLSFFLIGLTYMDLSRHQYSHDCMDFYPSKWYKLFIS
jgi:hypothetical protein